MVPALAQTAKSFSIIFHHVKNVPVLHRFSLSGKVQKRNQAGRKVERQRGDRGVRKGNVGFEQ
jgi:hypothetical protein